MCRHFWKWGEGSSWWSCDNCAWNARFPRFKKGDRGRCGLWTFLVLEDSVLEEPSRFRDTPTYACPVLFDDSGVVGTMVDWHGSNLEMVE